MLSNFGTIHHEKCIIPFKYKNKTHWKCIIDGPQDNMPWCPVEIGHGKIRRADYCKKIFIFPKLFKFHRNINDKMT